MMAALLEPADSVAEGSAVDELGQVSFRARPPDGAAEAVVEPDRVFEVAYRVELAPEQRGEAAEPVVDGSVTTDGAAGGDGSAGVRDEPFVQRGRVGDVREQHARLRELGLERQPV